MKVFLEEIQLNDLPVGLEDLEEILFLDLELHTYLIKYEIPLKFWGDGFKFINDQKKINGFCKKISGRIEVPETQGVNVIRFFFYLTDCQFQHTTNTCEVEIIDDTYGAFISDARDIKISPLAANSRDGSGLTPVTSTNITLFTPLTGVNLGTDAKMYKLGDVFDHLVRYLSNDDLQTSYDFLTDTNNFCLSSHFYIFNRGTDSDIQFSLKEVVSNMFKLFDFWFKMDQTTQPATFTAVQGEDNFFGTPGGITFANIRDLTEEFYQERFFSTVKVGDEDAIIQRSGSTYQLPTVPLVGFREEIYNAANDCVLEKELDLASEWIIDHNKIEQMLGSTTYEEKAVLIYCDTTVGVGDAYKGTYALQGAMRYYNEELLNFKVLNRHNIGTNLSQALGISTDDFLAWQSADVTYTTTGGFTIIAFDDDTAPEGFDTGANYDAVNFRYIAPQTGSYKFEVGLEYTIDGIQDDANFGFDGTLTIEIRIIRKNSVGTTLQTKEFDIVHLAETDPASPVLEIRFADFFLESTDYVEVQLRRTFLYAGATNSVTFFGVHTLPIPTDADTYGGCYFKTAFIFNNGGTIDTGALKDYKASALKFDGFPIPADNWNSIKANPTQSIYVNNGGANAECWVKEIRRNIKHSTSKVEMLTSPNLTNL